MGKDLKGKELGKGFYQRKDGRYEAKAMIAGRKIDLYDWNLKLLKQRFAKEKEHISSELKQPFESDLTLNQWFEEWFKVYKVPYIKPASTESMKRRFYGSFGKNLGNMKIRMIRSMDVQYVLNVLRSEGKASSSVREALGMFASCMEMACNNQLIVGNPCLNLKVYWDTVKKSTRNAISMEEQKRFLKAADASWYREFVYTLFLTGLRMGEMSGLCWRDVNWKNHCIRVHQSLGCEYHNGEKTIQFTALKTINSYRKIPFMGELEEILLSQKEKQEELRERLGVRYRAKDELLILYL
ncbi:MAG: tyrosine-type recombinase/integrase [Lachnospiraceae bacterium]|nr:tyrosine-type recombinase/integrase [Lachnospiraceae bacterium]